MIAKRGREKEGKLLVILLAREQIELISSTVKERLDRERERTERESTEEVMGRPLASRRYSNSVMHRGKRANRLSP